MTADLVLHGGRILVSAAAGSFVDALAVGGGRVVAAGSSERVCAEADAGTTVVDLAGRTVVPGLIDSHIHAVRAGLTWSAEVRWHGVPTLAEGLDEIARAASGRKAGSWVCVLGGWHPGQLAEGRLPTRADLDRAAPDHPAFAQLLYDGVVVNSAALRALPELAADEHDGWVPGMAAIGRCTAALGTDGHGEQEASTREFLAQLTRWGLTGIVDAGGFGMTPDRYEPLLGLAAAGALPLRVRLYVGAANPGTEEAEVGAWLEHLAQAPADELLSAVGIGELALFACHDGEGLEARTFARDALDRLEALTRQVAGAGRPMQLHAILDTSADAILGVWERVDRERPLAGLRFSLAHVEQISRRNLERARALGVGLAVQNRLALRAADTASSWGAGGLRSAPPLRTFLELGMPVAAGTDATRVAPPSPWRSIAWLVTGRQLDGGPARDPEQCLSLLEALEAYTAGSAWMSGEERERGRLLPGYRADLAVLAGDCFAAGADELPTMESVLTLVGGKPVHAAGGFAGLGR